MPQVSPRQSDAAQSFTSWVNNLDAADRDAMTRRTTGEAVDRWRTETGASREAQEHVIGMLADGIIALQDDGLWKNWAWSVDQ
ncbi:hypothetical protein ACT17_32760 [Mycolicibacterium conceptionense]|uniref:Uncharacterized protein n=1 Tax=Mycolicibacterium conceptionense TaxID=451644 RepID=A0A0J8WLR5_9MYCO|nr:hypothetical protein [Mycolicibacterium conceptionense]KMV13954.1 hypothetical protein ACT17_32760 [Mycolicibacterium conceptionense]